MTRAFDKNTTAEFADRLESWFFQVCSYYHSENWEFQVNNKWQCAPGKCLNRWREPDPLLLEFPSGNYRFSIPSGWRIPSSVSEMSDHKLKIYYAIASALTNLVGMTEANKRLLAVRKLFDLPKLTRKYLEGTN